MSFVLYVARELRATDCHGHAGTYAQWLSVAPSHKITFLSLSNFRKMYYVSPNVRAGIYSME